jgi:DNA-binding transcriptional MerR regulator
LKKFLRPVDLARAVGLSTQTIRSYEEVGLLPPSERSAQGYRRYSQHHLHALRVACGTIAAFGWENARHIMQAIHQDMLPQALAVIDARHAAIHRSRCEIEETLRILRATSETIQPLTQKDQRSRPRTSLQISEAAQTAHVRTSAVRFWEEQGLLHPVRDRDNGYRLYNAEQVRNIQIIALLRKAGYGFPAIRTVLTELAAGTPEQALAAAEQRLKELTEMSHRCMEATAALWVYITHQPG